MLIFGSLYTGDSSEFDQGHSHTPLCFRVSLEKSPETLYIILP